MVKVNKSRYAILGMLSLKDFSGYEIKKTMQASTSFFWRETDSSIYPMLGELEKEELVKGKEDSVGGRKRKRYSITGKGKKAFKEWLEIPSEPVKPRNELLLKLFFGNHAKSEIGLQHVEDYRNQLVELGEVYRGVCADISKEYKNSPNLPYWLITLNYGELHVKASLQWCDDTIKQLKKISKGKK